MAEKIKRHTVVRNTTHPSDTRPNIPTAELESFARPDEKKPTILRYPRNPDLDPPASPMHFEVGLVSRARCHQKSRPWSAGAGGLDPSGP